MIHRATTAFWECYQQLPAAIQQLADKNYELLKANPDHPSLHFKKVGSYRSVRVGIAYRALGIMDELWAARASLTVDDELDCEEWLRNHRRLVRRSAAPTARSRSPVPDHGDSYKDMYLREVNFNAALCSENALLIADNARLRSLTTEDPASANLSN